MKEAHDITLILPEGVALAQFEDIINLALKQAMEDYTVYYWDYEKNEEVEKNFGINDYSFKPIAATNGRIIFEFEIVSVRLMGDGIRICKCSR